MPDTSKIQVSPIEVVTPYIALANLLIPLGALAVNAIKNALQSGDGTVTIEIKLDKTDANAQRLIDVSDKWLAEHPET